jgi:predicted type IV restriction endonuclease
MAYRKSITSLVNHFNEHRESYRAGFFSEARLRRNFVEPMFRLLGWDIENQAGLNEDKREVVLSDSPFYTGILKAPDYCFRVDGQFKFFLEAKKPFADIKHGVRPAFQLRRFAWSAQLPFSIITDFEEMSIYDGRIRPGKTDRASRARVMYLTYDRFPKMWNELKSLLGRDSITESAFHERFRLKSKQPDAIDVSISLLEDYEYWRDQLARDIASRYKSMEKNLQITAARQIARHTIFLRICEARGIEHFGQLRGLLYGGEINRSMGALSRQVTDRHKSCLTHFGIDEDLSAHDLSVDDRILGRFIESLYYPESPYEFSVLPEEVVGQLLAHTIFI